MTGCELSYFLLSDFDFCLSFCGADDYYCHAMIYGGCPHEVAHTMYGIAINMLETA